MNRLYVLPILAFSLLALLVGPINPLQPRVAEAYYPGAEGIAVIAQHCTSLQTVQVTIGWEADGQGQQWADLTPYNNNFAPGTYSPVGPLAGSQQAVSWETLSSNTSYFMRINTQTASGWAPGYNAFVTMDCQQWTNVQPSELRIVSDGSLRDQCDDLHGRWDSNSCSIIRIDCERERDRDHDRDRDRRWDWDKGNDADRDHDDRDRDDHDRDGSRFDRDRDFDCDFNGLRIIFRS